MQRKHQLMFCHAIWLIVAAVTGAVSVRKQNVSVIIAKNNEQKQWLYMYVCKRRYKIDGGLPIEARRVQKINKER